MTDDAAHGSAGENHRDDDENYFVSMTDMMVGVLFIFIILLMVFALNFRQQTDTSEDRIKRLEAVEEQARQATEKLTQLQQQVKDTIEAIQQADNVRKQMLEEIEQALAARGVQVEISPQSGVLRLRDKAVLFKVNTSALSDTARANVRIIADVLSDILPKYTSESGAGAATVETVFLEGHTDTTGPDDENWRLSTARAVETYLGIVAAQPSLETLANTSAQKVISVSGYGETRPLLGVADDAQRRIDLRFVMKVDNQDRLEEVKSLTESMDLQLRDLTQKVQQARQDAPDGSTDGN